MPRRTAKAEEQAVLRALARIHLMVRHPEFLTDLEELRRKYPRPRRRRGNDYASFVRMQKLLHREQREITKQQNHPSFHDSYHAFRRKWNLAWFPSALMAPQPRRKGPITPQQIEQALIGSKHDKESLGWQNFLPARFAVVAEDPFFGQGWDELEGFYQWLPPDAPERGSLLDIHVDLSYPKDVLEALISKELAKAVKERARLRAAKPTSPSTQRFRSAQVAFQLQVYDLYQSGKDFEQIARALNKRTGTIKGRRNTVRSAYAAAVRKIQDLLGKPLPSPAKVHNYENCPTCKIATTTDQFCRTGKSQLPRPIK